MAKIALLVLADTQTYEGLGRIVNAMTAAKEFNQTGYEVQLILDGAATKWPAELAKSDHPYHDLYEQVKSLMQGCEYCANAFEAHSHIEKQSIAFANEFEGHPSFVRLTKNGYQIISF